MSIKCNIKHDIHLILFHKLELYKYNLKARLQDLSGCQVICADIYSSSHLKNQSMFVIL